MTTSTERSEWLKLRLELEQGAACVKTRSAEHTAAIGMEFGIIHSPVITCDDLRAFERELTATRGECNLIAQGYSGEVVVVGHGLMEGRIPGACSVWRGSAVEFNRIWRVD